MSTSSFLALLWVIPSLRTRRVFGIVEEYSESDKFLSPLKGCVYIKWIRTTFTACVFEDGEEG